MKAAAITAGTYGITGNIGPTVLCSATTGKSRWTSNLNGGAFPAGNTSAAIFMVTSLTAVNNDQGWFGFTSSGMTFGIQNTGGFTGQLFISGNSGFNHSGTGVVVSVNIPYFAIISTTLTATNFLLMRLDTGQIFTSNFVGTLTYGTLGNDIWVGTDGGGSNGFQGYLASVMYSSKYLSMQQMLLWASDPRAFWYPTPIANAAFDPVFVRFIAPPTAALLAQASVKFKSNAAFSGSSRLIGNAVTGIAARGSPIGNLPILGRTTVQSKSTSKGSFALALSGRGSSTVKSSAAAAGVVPLLARTAALFKSVALTSAMAGISGRTISMVKSSAAAAFVASLPGRVIVQTKVKAGPAVGVTGLSGRVAAHTKLLALASGAVGLSGRLTSQAKTGGVIGFFTFLTAKVAAAFKVSTPVAGASAIAGLISTTVKLRGKLHGDAIGLSGQLTAMAKMAGVPSGIVPLVGRVASQIKPRAIYSSAGLASLIGKISAAIRFGGSVPSTGVGTPYKYVQADSQIFRFGNVPIGQAPPTPKNPMLTGVAAMSGRATIQGRISALFGTGMMAALVGRVVARVKASIQPTGAAVLAGRMTTQAKTIGGLGIVTLVLIVGQIVTAVKGRALTAGATTLSVGRVTVAVKSRASTAGAAALAGRAVAAMKLAAAATGVVGLTGRLTTQIKVIPGLVNSTIAMLIGRIAAMTMVRGATSGTLPLFGRMTTQSKALGFPTGIVGLVGLVAAQVKSRVQVVSGSFVFMVGHVAAQAKASGSTIGAAVLAGRATTQARATAVFSGAVGLVGRVTAQVRARPALAALAALIGQAAIAVKASTPARAAARLAGTMKTSAAANAAPLMGKLALNARGTVAFKARGPLAMIANLVGLSGLAGSMFKSRASFSQANLPATAVVVVTSGAVEMTIQPTN